LTASHLPNLLYMSTGSLSRMTHSIESVLYFALVSACTTLRRSANFH
jgi:hypothetical protein